MNILRWAIIGLMLTALKDQNSKHMGYDLMLSANFGINFSSRLIWHMYFMQDLQGIIARQKLVLHGI